MSNFKKNRQLFYSQFETMFAGREMEAKEDKLFFNKYQFLKSLIWQKV